MSTFPALAPSSRIYTPGGVPLALQDALSGVSTGFRRGNRRVNQSLQLTFTHLTQADALLIRDHYFARNGTYEIFFLSAEIWADFDTPPVPLLSDFAWRYAAEPVIVDVSIDRFNVEVQLVTEPIDIGDLIFDAGLASAAPARAYILDAGAAAATPARDYIVTASGAL
jgi:hypothetical protein